jgi:hypothetical protein
MLYMLQVAPSGPKPMGDLQHVKSGTHVRGLSETRSLRAGLQAPNRG